MALVLRSNPSRLSSSTGALFVSNPKRKTSVKRNPKKRKSTRKNVSRRRKSTRKNPSMKKRVVRRNAAHKRRRNAVHRRKRVSIRRNALAISSRRNPVKRRSSKRHLRMNPVRKMLRKNPLKGLLPRLIASSKKLISKIPYVGKPIASNLALSVGGMLGGLALVYSYKKFDEMVDKESAKRPDSTFMEYVNIANKFGGIALIGIATGYLFKSKMGVDLLGKETSDLLSRGALYTGGALQAIRIYNIWASSKGKEQISVDDKVSQSAPAQSGLYLSDGGSYDVVPMSGAHQMGMMHRNARHLHGAHVSGLYMDSKSADAAMAGADLSSQEKRAAMSDESSYHHSFEQPPHRVTNTDVYSRHAGKHGHRWGWMIKMIGFDRFQKLAMLPPQKRVDLIAKMKRSAIASAQREFDQAEASGYQGLSIDMSGLAIDNMAGLAVVGSAV